jgi:hypothetical protein
VANSAAPPSLSLVVTGDPSTTAPYAVEAQTNRTSARVRFYVNSVLFRTETVEKYCLFGRGDGGALCTTGRLGNGTHAVQARLHDAVTGALLATTSKTILEGTPSPTLAAGCDRHAVGGQSLRGRGADDANERGTGALLPERRSRADRKRRQVLPVRRR